MARLVFPLFAERFAANAEGGKRHDMALSREGGIDASQVARFAEEAKALGQAVF
ncbi:MAG: hypothetical protein K6E40_13505 [Desulfovibrio sp.]|nr:hypothetical protein [Desulfovibrio sp.]